MSRTHGPSRAPTTTGLPGGVARLEAPSGEGGRRRSSQVDRDALLPGPVEPGAHDGPHKLRVPEHGAGQALRMPGEGQLAETGPQMLPVREERDGMGRVEV